jgi:hypothetical protein
MIRHKILIPIFAMAQLVLCLESNFYIDQFAPFEEVGFTEKMILGAKDVYFNETFIDDMNEVYMQLWTIIDQDIYLE